MVRATRFNHPGSVDAWDQWFRWRDGACLHDRTIDATWSRVARALTAGESDDAQWSQRYVEAFSRWQLLPDERLLRLAGTGHDLGEIDAPCAVLNAATFVLAPGTRQARFDDERFSDIAALAVHLLDDAMRFTKAAARRTSLRIGVIGFADALHLLGIDYVDTRAFDLADLLGNTLFTGTLQGELDLIQARGPLHAASDRLLSQWSARRVPPSKLDRVASQGMRHEGLTAIDSQPRLALLANCASNALDPHPLPDPAPAARQGEDPACSCHRESPAARRAAHRAVHAAIQPWIDVPLADAFDATIPATGPANPEHGTRPIKNG